MGSPRTLLRAAELRARPLAPALALVLLLGGGACRKWPHVDGETRERAPRGPDSAPRFAVTIHRPALIPGVTTARRDVRGKPSRIPCITCHRRVSVKPEQAGVERGTRFHAGIRLAHGGLTCRSCHQLPDLEGFALADGRPVAYPAAMRLCGQCHAQRLNEYERGVHGGMNGYWDLSRGPRTRNHCLDCHNAHAPAIPRMTPAPRHRPRPGL